MIKQPSSRLLVNDAPLAGPSAAAVSRTSDPPWHAAPNAIARRFHQICVAQISEVVGKGDLTPLQFAVLIHLNRLTGRPGIDQNGLAERLNIDRNTTSVLVEQLANKGLVERLVNKEDRRARVLSLTANGEKLYARLRPDHQAANDTILSPLTRAERDLLISLMIRVIEGNRMVAGDGKSKSRGHEHSLRSVAPPGEFRTGRRQIPSSRRKIDVAS
jgi:DNA-binding MarR family transcriptional regulator